MASYRSCVDASQRLSSAECLGCPFQRHFQQVQVHGRRGKLDLCSSIAIEEIPVCIGLSRTMLLRLS